MDKAMFALKISKQEKAAMDFTSKELGKTLSSIYYPFILEGMNFWIGVVVFYRLDIKNKMPLDRYTHFFVPKEIQDLEALGSGDGSDLEGVSDLSRIVPPIVNTFIELMDSRDLGNRLRKVFERVEFQPSDYFLASLKLNHISRNIGKQYIQGNQDFKKTDYRLMKDIFFMYMLKEYYQSTAIGSLKTLQYEWYNKRTSVNAFKNILIKEYDKLDKKKPVEALQIVEPIER